MPSVGLQLVQPIVLAGGRSRRFGRDKLAEPIRDSLLIDRPIRTLREVFGPRVAIVGECAPRVASRADLVIPDPYPGIGPIGGVLAALEYSRGPVFVLAGDLVAIDADTIRQILRSPPVSGAGHSGPHSSSAEPEPLATIASTDRPQPCIGLYQPHAAQHLRRAVARERFGLGSALPPDRVALVKVSPQATHNVNRPADLVDD